MGGAEDKTLVWESLAYLVEEVADGDGGSGGKAGLFDADDVAAGDFYGGAGVFVASMAGSMMPQDTDFERLLATTPTAELLELDQLSESAITDPGFAYAIAKRANQVRVRAASVPWGRRRARYRENLGRPAPVLSCARSRVPALFPPRFAVHPSVGR